MNYLFVLISHCLLFIGVGFSDSLTIYVPYENERDIVTDKKSGDRITKGDAKESLVNLVRLINSYLWFIIAAICMAVIIYAGFLMITGRGDEAQVKKGIMMMVYAGIGIGVSLMAYAIVNVIVNFFGSG